MRRLERQLILELIWEEFQGGEISCTRDHENKLKLTILVYSDERNSESHGDLIEYEISEFQLSGLRGVLLKREIVTIEQFLNFILNTLGIPDFPIEP